MTKENTPQEGLSDYGKQLAAQYMQEEKATKQAWLEQQKARIPLHPPTNEHGTFAGLIGYFTPVGARVVPYYQTASGIYFRERYDGQGKEVKQLDLERIKREQSAQLYTSETFLGE